MNLEIYLDIFHVIHTDINGQLFQQCTFIVPFSNAYLMDGHLYYSFFLICFTCMF